MHAVGSKLPIGSTPQDELTEESLTAYEVAYTGTFADRTTVGLAVYVNDLDNSINFTQLPSNLDPYTVANPPPGWALPPCDHRRHGRAGHLSAADRIYVSESRPDPPERRSSCRSIIASAARSRRSPITHGRRDPTILDDPNPFPAAELSLPPTHRVNAGFNFDRDRYLGSLSVSYSDKAFWSDVLTSPYHGFTDAYTTVNGSGGVKWRQGRITTLVKVNNIFNEDIQQHVFGDIIKRSVMFEARFKM